MLRCRHGSLMWRCKPQRLAGWATAALTQPHSQPRAAARAARRGAAAQAAAAEVPAGVLKDQQKALDGPGATYGPDGKIEKVRHCLPPLCSPSCATARCNRSTHLTPAITFLIMPDMPSMTACACC